MLYLLCTLFLLLLSAPPQIIRCQTLTLGTLIERDDPCPPGASPSHWSPEMCAKLESRFQGILILPAVFIELAGQVC